MVAKMRNLSWPRSTEAQMSAVEWCSCKNQSSLYKPELCGLLSHGQLSVDTRRSSLHKANTSMCLNIIMLLVQPNTKPWQLTAAVAAQIRFTYSTRPLLAVGALPRRTKVNWMHLGPLSPIVLQGTEGDVQQGPWKLRSTELSKSAPHLSKKARMCLPALSANKLMQRYIST